MTPRFPTPQLLAARWYPGQSWRVEYTRGVPSPAKSPSAPPRPPERAVWRYEVMKPAAESGAIQILASEEGGEGRLELWFDAAPLILRRVVSFARSGPIDLIVHAGPQPYFGWS